MSNFRNCSAEDKEKLRGAGFEVEDREYTADEIDRCKYIVTDYVMNHSTKEISKLSLEYNKIFAKIE